MSSVSLKDSSKHFLCDFKDVSSKFAVDKKFLWWWFLFCCFFLKCTLKVFMETQCLHFGFPSTRGKQISKSDISYETSQHLFLFLMNVQLQNICEYILVLCIYTHSHTHICIHMHVCMLKFSSTQQRRLENVSHFSCLLQSIYLKAMRKVWWSTNMFVCSPQRMTRCLWEG